MPTKRPVGRPSKYKPEYCERVIEDMSTGLSLTAFAGSIPVARSTINVWMDQHPEFSEAVKVGTSARVRRLEMDLLTADQGPRVTSRIFALKNAAPDEWKDKHDHNVEGAITVEIVRFGDRSSSE